MIGSLHDYYSSNITAIIISDDSDFSYAISFFKSRGQKVVVICNSHALKLQKAVRTWYDFAALQRTPISEAALSVPSVSPPSPHQLAAFLPLVIALRDGPIVGQLTTNLRPKLKREHGNLYEAADCVSWRQYYAAAASLDLITISIRQTGRKLAGAAYKALLKLHARFDENWRIRVDGGKDVLCPRGSRSLKFYVSKRPTYIEEPADDEDWETEDEEAVDEEADVGVENGMDVDDDRAVKDDKGGHAEIPKGHKIVPKKRYHASPESPYADEDAVPSKKVHYSSISHFKRPRSSSSSSVSSYDGNPAKATFPRQHSSRLKRRRIDSSSPKNPGSASLEDGGESVKAKSPQVFIFWDFSKTFWLLVVSAKTINFQSVFASIITT
jgi:hypothetical protein